ncbi:MULTISPECIES: hypothetical protein [Stutzerimonas stutzeri group]|uniref:hypothetical protein n=1 Tax=Stutzerimonas stutzeri group TaxID=136846 RepID=UPI0022AF4664|nr:MULTISPECIES: hypothetical protein [Stutzerimonas stutzeri group]MCZ4128327.1 hypothetical protein [Stutzerimonas balearica]
MKFRYLLLPFVTALLTGCGTANNYLAQKTKTVEYYRIFDVKTDVSRQAIAKAASDGLGRNVGSAEEAMPIPSSNVLPETPGRFQLVNPFEGTRLAALAGGAGSLGFRMATCDGAVWTAKARREISGSNNLNLTACLFQYTRGYHLNLYAVFTKQEGGVFQVSRDMANAMVGTPEEWTEKTFLDVIRSIQATTPSKIELLEAQPEIAGTPWLDSLDAPTR